MTEAFSQNKLDQYKATLGKNIKYIRETVGYTQTEFAKQTGVSQGFISDVEKGKKTPGGEFFISMLDPLNVDLHYLITGEGNIFRDVVTESSTVGDRVKLIRLENHLTEKEFAEALEISVSELVSIERNMIEPAQTILILISHKFDADLNWLNRGGEREEKANNDYLDLKKGVEGHKNRIQTLESQNGAQEEMIFSQKEIISSLKETIRTQRELLSTLKLSMDEMRGKTRMLEDELSVA